MAGDGADRDTGSVTEPEDGDMGTHRMPRFGNWTFGCNVDRHFPVILSIGLLAHVYEDLAHMYVCA